MINDDDTNDFTINLDYHGHNDEEIAEAKALAKAHWNYVKKNIDLILDFIELTLDFTFSLTQQNYEDAFVHGYSHGTRKREK